MSVPSPGPGGTNSGSRLDIIQIEYEFELFTLDNNRNLRTAEFVKDSPKTFTFSGAIENFTARFNDPVIDNNFGFDLINVTNRFAFDNELPPTSFYPLTLDLTARYLPEGSPITLPDGTPAVTVIRNVDNGSVECKKLKAEGADRIEYVLSNNEVLENLGVNELTLILEDADKDKKGFQVDENKDEPGFQVRGQTVGIEAATIEKEDAISDIEYIVNKGLLGLYNNIRVSGVSNSDVNKIVSFEGEEPDLEKPSVPIVIEAEKLKLKNYLVEQFQGEQFISLRDVPKDPLTGQATGKASLSAEDYNLVGDYNLKIGYFDENDGEAKLQVFVNNKPEGDPIILNENTSSGLPTQDILQEETVTLNNIKIGDTIKIQGTSDMYEWARIDYIVFEQIIPPPDTGTELV